MRWVFLLLLMANAFYFFWWYQQPVESAGEQSSASGTNDVATLVLLEEVAPVGEEKGEAEKEAPEPTESAPPEEQEQKPVPDTPAVTRQCWLLGPVRDEARARAIVEKLRAQEKGLDMELRPAEIEGKSDFWVHLGPFPTRTDALAQYHELQAKGIDSFVIREGELENAVSLGLFSSRERAERARKQYVARDYPAEIHEVVRREEGVAIRVSGPVSGERLGEMLSEGAESGAVAEISKKTCP